MLVGSKDQRIIMKKTNYIFNKLSSFIPNFAFFYIQVVKKLGKYNLDLLPDLFLDQITVKSLKSSWSQKWITKKSFFKSVLLRKKRFKEISNYDEMFWY